MKTTDFADIIPLQPCPWVSGPAAVNKSALANHVSRVVRGRAEEQMCRVDTQSLVAPMEYTQPIRYCSDRQLIRDTMGQLHGAIELEPPIAFIGYAMSPQPAHFWSSYFGL